MIGKSLALIMLLLLVAPVTFAGEERYLCVADKSSGFKFDETLNEWIQANFNVSGIRYIITRINSKDSDSLDSLPFKPKYEVKQVGFPFSLCWSEWGFDNEGFAYFKCVGGELKFNKKTGRYLLTQREGYISGDEGDGLFAPHIEIGKCSPF
jgi:hypothetical protein